MTITIRATEAARDFSNILSKVYYQGESFEIKRGKEIVAKLVPVTPAQKMSAGDLNAFFQTLPALEKSDSDAFKEDIKILRNQMKTPQSQWD